MDENKLKEIDSGEGMTDLDNVRGLVARCMEVISSPHGNTRVLLVIPGGPPRGERVRLVGRKFGKCPMGEPVNWQDNPPRTVAYFDAMDVLAWLAANGVVKVNIGEAGNK